MNFDDADAVIRVRLEIENRREDFLDRVFQEAAWDTGKARIGWCVGVHVADSLTRLLVDPKELEDCLFAIKDSIEGRLKQFHSDRLGHQ